VGFLHVVRAPEVRSPHLIQDSLNAERSLMVGTQMEHSSPSRSVFPICSQIILYDRRACYARTVAIVARTRTWAVACVL
jgi:hypothetical protein